MRFALSPLLLPLAASFVIPIINAALAQGTYAINNSLFPETFLSSPSGDATAPAGWSHQGPASQEEYWQFVRFGIGWSISNKATGKYVSLVNNQIALDIAPFAWLVLEGFPMGNNLWWRIQDPRSRSAALALNSPFNGTLLSLEPYTESAEQHWLLQPVQ
jgi:hypothetical protein